MNPSPFSKESTEEIASSNIPLALFKIEVKKVIPVIISAGLLQGLSLSLEEAASCFEKDSLFLVQDEMKSGVRKALDSFLKEQTDFDEEITTKYGTHTTFHKVRVSGKLLEIDGKRYAYFLFTDLTPYLLHHSNERSNTLHLNNAEVKIRKDLFDGLTGLPNMSHFLDLVSVAKASMIGRKRPFCVLSFDFIGMKSFNLKFGTSEGDKLLKEFASLLSRTFSQLCCSRFGEDHFYAFALAQGLEAILSRFFEEAKKLNHGNSLPVKVGVYRYKENERNTITAFDKAKFACDSDRLTYASHYVFFTDEMEKDIEMRDYVLSHLDEALEKDWIKAYYQPIFRSVNGLVCNEEALARWEDPVLGVVSPKDFIPYLEEARLLYKVDIRMIELIVKGFDEKRKANIPLVPVSLNLSRFDFEQADMVEEVAKAMKKGGYPHSLLTIEITEAVAGHDQEFIRTQIKRFHDAGFKVWMDDFGAGYSSLNVLSDLDFDLVKIDMKFMRNFMTNEKVRPLLSSILQMAQSLGVDTLCEGVETFEQLVFLQNYGCDRIQGFYYEKPIPLAKILDRSSKWGRENPLDTPYYDEVGEACLVRPKGVENEQGARAGILEYQEGKFHLLRGTAAYREFLEKGGMVNFSSFTKTRLPFTRSPTPAFINAVERAISSGNPVSFPFLEKGMPAYQAIVREIARKGFGSPCYAILVVLEPSSEEYLVEESLFPTLTLKLIRDANGKAVNLRYLDCNKKQETLSGIPKSKLLTMTLADTFPDASMRWIELCLEAKESKSEITGEFYSRDVSRNIFYSVSPLWEEDTFFFRFYEIREDEILNMKNRHDVGADSLLYKAAKTLAEGHSVHTINLFLGELSRGLSCRFALYKTSKGISRIVTYTPQTSKAPAFIFSPNRLASFDEQIAKYGHYDSLNAPEKNGLTACSRAMAAPIRKGEEIVGYLTCFDYPLDKRDETGVCLLESAGMLTSFLIVKNKEAPADLNLAKNSLTLKKTKINRASFAEKNCLDSLNMSVLTYCAPFFAIVMVCLVFAGMSLGSSVFPNASLYDIPAYALPRFLVLGVYTLFSIAATWFAIYYRKRRRLISHKAVEAVLLIYFGLTTLFGVFLSWQDYQLGVFDIIYALSMLYLFCCYRTCPWKAMVYLASGFLFLSLFCAFVPCLPESASLLNCDLSPLYYIVNVGIVVVCAFLGSVLYNLSLRMFRLSTIDSLTQMRNRFALDFDKKKFYGHPCFLMVLDIDDFKHWNDTYGHEKGDQLLIEFSALLKDVFGKGNVYRYGGDEFVVLLNGDRDAFEGMIASFQNRVRQELSNGLEKVSFTGGYREVAFNDDAGFLAAVSACDALLYEGKKSGKSTIVGR